MTTETWEIVAGDFGGDYRATTPKGLNLSDCKAKVKIWKGSTILIDYLPEAGLDVTYDSDADESYCDYRFLADEIPLSAAIDGKKTEYDVKVRFTKTDFQEHDLGFKLIVHPAPPVAEV